MISKTKINKRMKKKTNPELAETIFLARKSNLELAKILSRPTRGRVRVNLEKIDKESKAGETVIIPGKVLGEGNIDKKIKVVALSFSLTAEEKLKKAGCKTSIIKKEIEKNKKLEGKIIK